MARLEWLYVELFDAEDTSALDARALAELPRDAFAGARIVFATALARLEVRYPVAELRHTLRETQSRPSPLPEADPHGLVLYRDHDGGVGYERVSDAAFAVLGELMSGVPLVPACERVVERRPELGAEIETSIGAWFENWGRRGLIADVEVDAST